MCVYGTPKHMNFVIPFIVLNEEMFVINGLIWYTLDSQ